ncbi:MAG: hypothetical protein MG2_0257 [uncultured Candidatus Poseidoniales archaeon]|nr:MAG: hypothetical protein MG2_0257 [uncultured Candidatus Poseidoniales archaeon]
MSRILEGFAPRESLFPFFLINALSLAFHSEFHFFGDDTQWVL